MDALSVHKALGDDTRFAIYRELTLATSPISAQEIADRLGLHPNTVRPHLERMREADLVSVETIHRGTPGRPQHRYSLAAGAPGLGGVEPPAHTLLAGMLAAVAERAGAESLDATAIGRGVGRESIARDGVRRTAPGACIATLLRELDRLGFEPSEEPRDGRSHIAFLRCPFRELAEAYPELVCNLHRGITEGVVEAAGGGMVERFQTLYDRDHCSVVVRAEYPETSPDDVEDPHR
jgi:predicted ArsR family transcriptional regulator